MEDSLFNITTNSYISFQTEAAANARTTTNTIKKSHTGTATATVTTATSQIDVGLPQEWTY